jgi:hypothetical protein
MAHLFGHAHHVAQVLKQDGILFSNGTQGERTFLKSKPVIIDVYLPSTDSAGDTQHLTEDVDLNSVQVVPEVLKS